jgi:hypothetical protein
VSPGDADVTANRYVRRLRLSGVTCPHLSYRTSGDGREFATARAYCAVADRFVQPMRADVCNDRYDLDHATDCEIYLARADDPAGVAGADADPDADDSVGATDADPDADADR